MNTYYGGIASKDTDTISIRTLNENQLILVKKNAASEYGKFAFKK